jgi:hypothetical protein
MYLPPQRSAIALSGKRCTKLTPNGLAAASGR